MGVIILINITQWLSCPSCRAQPLPGLLLDVIDFALAQNAFGRTKAFAVKSIIQLGERRFLSTKNKKIKNLCFCIKH